jgi:hypothetical protein
MHFIAIWAYMNRKFDFMQVACSRIYHSLFLMPIRIVLKAVIPNITADALFSECCS